MLSIDGLVTGIDTASIIDGLLQIQQQQVDRELAKRATILGKQTAFSGIEARLLGFRGALGRLTSIATTAINDKTITSSQESLVTGAASDNATVGVYRLRVDQLASAHQLATAGFASPDSIVTNGTLEIKVGNETATQVKVDGNNNTAQGLVDAINASDADVTATIINNGSGGSESYQILLTSNATGASNEIQLAYDFERPVGSEITPAFNIEVDAAKDAQVTFGTGDGAITVNNDTNQIEDLIAGVTLNLNGADADQEITLNVAQDVESSRAAVDEFVDSYNELVTYFNDQLRFNAETLQGGPLLGESAVVSIQNEIQQTISSVVGGVNGQLNTLSSLGISVSDTGTLNINSTQLDDALAGRVEGVSTNDVARLFALSGASTNGGFRFVTGGASTAEGVVEVDITSAAERASVLAEASLASSITIDASNDSFSLVVDGKQSSELTLAHGTYTQEEIAAELEAVINADDELTTRDVSVVVDNGSLRMTTESIGSASDLGSFSGKALESLGFAEDQVDRGQDVVGRFIVDGEIEEAIGTGNLLRGNEDNEKTADLQIRVTLGNNQLVDGAEGEITVSRGIAAKLDAAIGDLLKVGEDDPGRLSTVNDRFDTQLEDIQDNIDLFNERFEAERESLVRQFAALESAVAELQTTGNFLASLLPSV